MTAKVRPALVISIPADDIDRALVTLVPHTTSARNSRLEVTSQVPFLKSGVFDAQNLITIPHAKLVRAPGRLPASQLASVERAVCLWLGLPQPGIGA
jgi:mRNA interferase MazF